MTNETGWLIDDGRLCLGTCSGKLHWTVYTDPQAIRFARKQDAENMLSALKNAFPEKLTWFADSHAVDHMWCDGPTAQTPGKDGG